MRLIGLLLLLKLLLFSAWSSEQVVQAQYQLGSLTNVITLTNQNVDGVLIQRLVPVDIVTSAPREHYQEFYYQVAIGIDSISNQAQKVARVLELYLDRNGAPKEYLKHGSAINRPRLVTLYVGVSNAVGGQTLCSTSITNDASKLATVKEISTIPTVQGLDAIETYQQRFSSWEAIAKSNRVGNYMKWLDGQKVEEEDPTNIPFAPNDEARCLFLWQSNQASLRLVHIVRALPGAPRDEPLNPADDVALFVYPNYAVKWWYIYAPIVRAMLSHAPQVVAEYMAEQKGAKKNKDEALDSLFSTNAALPAKSL